MSLIISLIESAQGHYPLVLLMVFLLTFTKSCALVSLAIPGTSGLLLLGTFASASLGHFLLMWSSASSAPSADSGSRGGWAFAIVTALRSYAADRRAAGPQPTLFSAPRAVGGLFQPLSLSLRATLPLVSGASGLPLWSFQLANVSSGLLWPFLLLSPGALSLSLW